MRLKVAQEAEGWYYRIIYPGGGGLGSYHHASELDAWQALARHLAELAAEGERLRAVEVAARALLDEALVRWSPEVRTYSGRDLLALKDWQEGARTLLMDNDSQVTTTS